MTLSLTNAVMSVPAAYRLYLPEEWTNDRRRCREAGVPKTVTFQKKWALALAAIDALLADELPRARSSPMRGMVWPPNFAMR